MRVFKFRAWSKELGMSDAFNVDAGMFECVLPDAVMQFTGLKDKNDKEIYEGDIVDATYCIDGCLYYSEDEYGIVVWDDKKCGFFIKFKGEIDVTPISYYSSLKVMGNIYENQELLNDEDVRVLGVEAQVYGK